MIAPATMILPKKRNPTPNEARNGGLVGAAPEWTLERGEGAGPFTSRLVWRLPEGGEATWESRSARKRGAIALRAKAGGAARVLRAPAVLARRLRRVNWVAAGAFTIGGSLFALGRRGSAARLGRCGDRRLDLPHRGTLLQHRRLCLLLGAINGPRTVAANGTLPPAAGAGGPTSLTGSTGQHLHPLRGDAGFRHQPARLLS